MEQKPEGRVHRVGSITLGGTLVVFGILFLVHTIGGLLSYEIILKLWPLILVSMGVEVLVCNVSHNVMKYDKGSVAMLILMGILASGLAVSDMAIQFLENHI